MGDPYATPFSCDRLPPLQAISSFSELRHPLHLIYIDWILLPSCGYWCSSCTATFPWNSQECGGAWCKNLPAQVNILCFFWTQAPTGCETVLTWATSLPKSEYCTIVGLLRLWPWWWFFSGITLPTRWAECLGRKAVGQWTIIRAVATPYPKSIPSHPILMKHCSARSGLGWIGLCISG